MNKIRLLYRINLRMHAHIGIQFIGIATRGTGGTRGKLVELGPYSGLDQSWDLCIIGEKFFER